MTKCKKCGAQKRSWPRSCPRCRAGEGREDVVADAADLAVPAGLFEWIGQGVMTVVRLVVRAVT
ncbi:hypothetical protein [Streptomyces sp. NPDC093109]|uniref:hypothetical protein n=1 Tax=Streptomyces sp. NPDC093109 TaxID=3154977 RepID=UPI0034500411